MTTFGPNCDLFLDSFVTKSRAAGTFCCGLNTKSLDRKSKYEAQSGPQQLSLLVLCCEVRVTDGMDTTPAPKEPVPYPQPVTPRIGADPRVLPSQ